jgi:hypothetical protein
MTKKVYMLHGVASRDPKELVCMFFVSIYDRKKFVDELPGRYRYRTLVGIGYDDFEVK